MKYSSTFRQQITYFLFILQLYFAEIAKQKAPVAIVGGENYGQGSSREHAALAPRYLGVRVVFAKSFARLHRANLINFGIVSVIIDQNVYNILDQGVHVKIKELRKAISEKDNVVIDVREKGVQVEGKLLLSERERKILLSGGSINYCKETLR